MPSVAILIDGSNFLAQLDDCGLSYPALAPLMKRLCGTDDLGFATFYGAPYVGPPYRARWEAFRSANRHIKGLSWFQGFRNAEGTEKAIDVALAVDLILCCDSKSVDRMIVIGGDGDHTYALMKAAETGMNLVVYLMPAQHASNLNAIGVKSAYFSVANLLAWEVRPRSSVGRTDCP